MASDEPQPMIGSIAEGYPCPKDGFRVQLFEGGAWCPECHTVWREVGEIDLADLDALPEVVDETEYVGGCREPVIVGRTDRGIAKYRPCGYMGHYHDECRPGVTEGEEG